MVLKRGWQHSTPPKVQAKYESLCPECWEEIEEGQTIYWSEHHGAYVCSISCQ